MGTNMALSAAAGGAARATDRTALENDLRWAAQRQLGNFYRQAGGADERKYPTLAHVVRTVVGEHGWYGYPTTSLIRVIRTAIARLPEQLTGRRPEEPTTATKPRSWRGAPERQMAEILYGYRQDLVPEREHLEGEYLPPAYDDYLSAAFRHAGLKHLNKRDRGRVTQVIRQDLADVLLAMEQETLRVAPGTFTDLSTGTPMDLRSGIGKPGHKVLDRAALGRLLLAGQISDAIVLATPEDVTAVASLLPPTTQGTVVLALVVVAPTDSGRAPEGHKPDRLDRRPDARPIRTGQQPQLTA